MPLLFQIILIIILGSSLGSFFNVCIYRIPAKKSLVFPSSYCPNCHTPIPFWLNIPILGFLLTRGKCKECRTKIHWHYPLVEFIAVFLFLMLFFRLGNDFSFIYFKYSILVGVFIIVFFIDIFHQIIPDVLSLPLIVLGLLAALHSANDITLRSSLLGAATAFLLFYLIALAYWQFTGKMGVGGGDIKLITGIGAFIGFTGILFTILVSSVTALVILLIIRYNLKKEFPFGPFLITGTLIFIFFGSRIISWYLDLFLF